MISDKTYRKFVLYARNLLRKEGVSVPSGDEIGKVIAEIALGSISEAEIDSSIDADRKIDLANEKVKLEARISQIDLEINTTEGIKDV